MAFDDFARTLRLRWYFSNSKSKPLFYIPNPQWNPPKKNSRLEKSIYTLKKELENLIQHTPYVKKTFSKKLQNALHSIKNNPNIIIKPADKNLGLTILDTSWYLNEGQRQLSDTNTYLPVTSVPLENLIQNLKAIVIKSQFLLDEEKKYILHKPTNGFRICPLYFTPKIHKPTLVGRPICAYNDSIFEHASKWLHHELYPILLDHKQNLLDSTTLIKELRAFKLPLNSYLFSFDIEALYPSIPTNEGLLALKSTITQYFPPHKVEFIISLATLILKNHYLTFNQLYWRQIKGTAMGSNFAVVYACIFLSYMENKQHNTCPHKELIYYKRYIDDAIGIWHGDKTSLTLYLSSYAKEFHPHIRINHTISDNAIDILDIQFYKGHNFSSTLTLSSRIHQKAYNQYQYLPYNSYHPKHQKISFITGEIRRYIIRESTLEGFIKLRNLFYFRLRARGYPSKLILFCFNKLQYGHRLTLLESLPKRTTSKNRAPLVFKLQHNCFTQALNMGAFLTLIRANLTTNCPELEPLDRPTLAWINPPKISHHLVKNQPPTSQKSTPH